VKKDDRGQQEQQQQQQQQQQQSKWLLPFRLIVYSETSNPNLLMTWIDASSKFASVCLLFLYFCR
jgi:hypothetical protein